MHHPHHQHHYSSRNTGTGAMAPPSSSPSDLPPVSLLSDAEASVLVAAMNSDQQHLMSVLSTGNHKKSGEDREAVQKSMENVGTDNLIDPPSTMEKISTIETIEEQGEKLSGGTTEKQQKICCLCGAPSKYNCPKCDRQTCCLSCVKQHKVDFQCTGVHNRGGGNVSLTDFSDAQLRRDYHFVEEVKQQIDVVQRSFQSCGWHYNFRTLPPPLHALREAAKKRGVLCQIMSEGLTKRDQNTSRYDRKQDSLIWHVEFRIYHKAWLLGEEGQQRKACFTVATDWGSERFRLLDILEHVTELNPQLETHRIRHRYNRAANWSNTQQKKENADEETEGGKGNEVESENIEMTKEGIEEKLSLEAEERNSDGAEGSNEQFEEKREDSREEAVEGKEEKVEEEEEDEEKVDVVTENLFEGSNGGDEPHGVGGSRKRPRCFQYSVEDEELMLRSTTKQEEENNSSSCSSVQKKMEALQPPVFQFVTVEGEDMEFVPPTSRDLTLQFLLDSFFKKAATLSNLPSSDHQDHLLRSSDQRRVNFSVLAKAERLGTEVAYFKLDPTETLHDCLRELFFIVEYPVFEIVHTQDLHLFSLITEEQRTRIRESFRSKKPMDQNNNRRGGRSANYFSSRNGGGDNHSKEGGEEKVVKPPIGPPGSIPVPCRNNIRGRCAHGELCPYIHYDDPSQLPACRNMVSNGSCPLGHKCSFSHDPESISAAVVKKQQEMSARGRGRGGFQRGRGGPRGGRGGGLGQGFYHQQRQNENEHRGPFNNNNNNYYPPPLPSSAFPPPPNPQFPSASSPQAMHYHPSYLQPQQPHGSVPSYEMDGDEEHESKGNRKRPRSFSPMDHHQAPLQQDIASSFSVYWQQQQQRSGGRIAIPQQQFGVGPPFPVSQSSPQQLDAAAQLYQARLAAATRQR